MSVPGMACCANGQTRWRRHAPDLPTARESPDQQGTGNGQPSGLHLKALDPVYGKRCTITFLVVAHPNVARKPERLRDCYVSTQPESSAVSYANRDAPRR